MAVVRNRFKELLAEKERREGRAIDYDEVHRETGVHPTTLSAYATNRVTRFDGKTVLALCQYFGCDPGDLLVIDGHPKFRQGLAYDGVVS